MIPMTQAEIADLKMLSGLRAEVARLRADLANATEERDRLRDVARQAISLIPIDDPQSRGRRRDLYAAMDAADRAAGG